MWFMGHAQVANPRKPRMTTAIRFPEELHERLRVAAENFGLPINFIVVKAMEEFLDQMIDPSEFRLTKQHLA
jgi:predicted DNA-binding protein